MGAGWTQRICSNHAVTGRTNAGSEVDWSSSTVWSRTDSDGDRSGGQGVHEMVGGSSEKMGGCVPDID